MGAWPRRALLGLLVLGTVVTSANAQLLTITDKVTDFDRWFYPNNVTPGLRSAASTFGGDLTVDNRFAQVILGFDTSADVPVGRGPHSYAIQSAQITLTTSLDQSFDYDPTYDEVATYLDPALDTDPGRPIELFGAALRNGFTAYAFGPTDLEDDLFQESDSHGPEGIGVRNGFPTDMGGITPRDVSNNVSDGFEVDPWAIGLTSAVTPGAAVPQDVEFTFSIDLSNSAAVGYLQDGLDNGALFLAVTSLHSATQMVPTEIPQFWMREASGFAEPPQLDLQVTLVAGVDGDFNDDGVYDCDDVDPLVAAIVAGTDPASFDLTGDGVVNTVDLDAWRGEAGAINLASGRPYLRGDANLDGAVDGGDFIAWNENKFSPLAEWCGGDFNADGAVDGGDFIVWNDHKFTSSDLQAVPEPGWGIGLLIALALLYHKRG